MAPPKRRSRSTYISTQWAVRGTWLLGSTAFFVGMYLMLRACSVPRRPQHEGAEIVVVDDDMKITATT